MKKIKSNLIKCNLKMLKKMKYIKSMFVKSKHKKIIFQKCQKWLKNHTKLFKNNYLKYIVLKKLKLVLKLIHIKF